jgi:DNA-binding CsgD family transcriptional regulator
VLGLAARQAAGYLPVPPAVALEALECRQLAAVAEARVTVGAAYERYRRVVGELGSAEVETLTPAVAQQRLAQAVAAALKWVRVLDSPPYLAPRGERAVALATELLARGVQYRAIYCRAALEWPGNLEAEVLPLIDVGTQARVLPDLPVKLWLVDESTAFLTLTHRDVDRAAAILAVRSSPLLAALAGLFEASWQQAVPLYPRVDPAAPVWMSPADRRLLAVLAAGLSDEVAARELGISRRTFYRRLDALMARSGSATRFQLALHTAYLNWL